MLRARTRLHTGTVSSGVQPNANAAASIRPVSAHTCRPAQARTDSGLTQGSALSPAAPRILAMAIDEDACIDGADPWRW